MEPELHMRIHDASDVCSSYMPFIQNGALFVATSHTHTLGDTVRLLIHWMDEPEPHVVEGPVVWVTPPGTQSNRTAGVGVQLDPRRHADLRTRIDACLNEVMRQEKSSLTL